MHVFGCGGSVSGGDPAACQQADQVETQIREAARQDGLSTTGVCASRAYEALATDRAAQYAAACAKLADLQKQCNGG